jgi:adenylate cyclase
VHLELRLDFGLDQAWLTDLSTNGTRLNGQRIERSIPVRIKPGDRIRLGPAELEFRSERFAATAKGDGLDAIREPTTLREVAVLDMIMVVGDIVSFSAIAETTGGRALLENIDRLYGELRQILSRHHGTLSNYVGDAFFATWQPAAVPDAARVATAFAVEAAETVPRIAAGLDLREPGGGPLRMGWGVASGPAAVSRLTGMLVTVLGDATNVAFRLSGLAGRDGRPEVSWPPRRSGPGLRWPRPPARPLGRCPEATRRALPSTVVGHESARTSRRGACTTGRPPRR